MCRKRIRLLILLLLGIVLPMKALMALSPPETLQATPQQRDDYDWMARHAEVLALHQQVPPEIVFIGDSITHHWGGVPIGKRRVAPEVWDELFAGVTVSNLGFGFDYADNAYWRILNGELDGIAPRQIFINIGTNNLGYRGDSPQQCAAHIIALVRLIQRRQPQAEIIVLGIYPRREAHLVEPIRQTNLLVQQGVRADGVRFVDVGRCLAGEDGRALSHYFRDVVHPNRAGYARLAVAMRPLIVDGKDE